MILGDGPNKTFVPFDRFAQFEESRGKSLADLLAEFKEARRASLARLRERRLTAADLERTGIHPTFGPVTARQLLATWAAHDLDLPLGLSVRSADAPGRNVSERGQTPSWLR